MIESSFESVANAQATSIMSFLLKRHIYKNISDTDRQLKLLDMFNDIIGPYPLSTIEVKDYFLIFRPIDTSYDMLKQKKLLEHLADSVTLKTVEERISSLITITSTSYKKFFDEHDYFKDILCRYLPAGTKDIRIRFNFNDCTFYINDVSRVGVYVFSKNRMEELSKISYEPIDDISLQNYINTMIKMTNDTYDEVFKGTEDKLIFA